jgi:integrase
LRDYALSTRKEYLRWVMKVGKALGQDPSVLSEAQVRDFFVHLRVERKASAPTIKMARKALRLFFGEHLKVGRDWELWRELRVRACHKLPDLLEREEIARLLVTLRHDRLRTLLALIYHTGLRLGEALHLGVQDIDSAGLRLHVRHSQEHGIKNRRERYVPISPAMLENLRRFYRRHRHPQWIFPALSQHWQSKGLSLAQAAAQGPGPMSQESVCRAMSAALAECGIAKQATPHT